MSDDGEEEAEEELGPNLGVSSANLLHNASKDKKIKQDFIFYIVS